MELSLSVTKLRHHFVGALFSAYEIQKWKPDPSLFLHAATRMGIAPDDCLVVEDSLHGAAAARAAGMRALGYCQPAESEAFIAAGAQCFSAMSELPHLISSS